MATKSEQLFEQYCESNRIPCTRIPEADTQRPDYSIRLGAVEVICEVKQVEESDAERLAFRQAIESGEPAAFFSPNQLRSKLRKLSQLKSASAAGKPTILVVYDATPFGMALDHWNVVEALFGEVGYLETFETDTPRLVDARPVLGGKRGLTPKHNTSVSAVAILEAVDGALVLRIYHNPHARVPLDPALLQGAAVDCRFRPGDTSICMAESGEQAHPADGLEDVG